MRGHPSSARDLLGDNLRQSEVGDTAAAIGVDEDVGALQVAVNQAIGVQELHAASYVLGVPAHDDSAAECRYEHKRRSWRGR